MSNYADHPQHSLQEKWINVCLAFGPVEKAPESDLVVTPWPSDHRASMAVVEF